MFSYPLISRPAVTLLFPEIESDLSIRTTLFATNKEMKRLAIEQADATISNISMMVGPRVSGMRYIMLVAKKRS